MLREGMAKMQLDVLARLRSELPLELRDFGRGERRFRDLRERGPCAVMLAVGRERLAIRFLGRPELAGELERGAEVVLEGRLGRA